MKSAAKSFWKLPVYCLVMGWVCFELKVRVLSRFTVITGPGGAIESSSIRSLIVSGILFLIVVQLGGYAFCDRMSRREVTISAAVLAVLTAALDLVSHFTNSPIAYYWAMCSEWSRFISQIVYRIIPNEWVSAIVGWFTPFVFVPYGMRIKKKKS